ncbi:gibberellin-regulated protein 9-like [Ziziphus jujuba]|uniref:Gibberellin-regulated protein 9-like n=1 Tax=Ziziphus jujuba TaxID=326968 RepID=A0ABM3INL6_ZIZJJ|nr:gibberellin-regulated protein 9-like [Ziziphus jujuba]
MKKLFSIFIMAILLLQAFVEASSSLSDAANSPTKMDQGNAVVALNKKPHLPKINCNQACSKRCKKASKKKRCKRACKACCIRCHCVPPGTYGHKSVCPCYARLRTHGNKLKCP